MQVFAVSRWTAGLVDGSELLEQPSEETVLDRGGLEDLIRRGHEVGSHTASHPRLTRLDDDAVRKELAESRESLAALPGGPPRWLAYPYGNIAPRIMEIARQCGYVGAVSTIRDNRVAGADPFALPRVMVQPGTSSIRFRYMLSLAYSLIHRMKNRRRWTGMKTQ
jgi:peptidoglycan/xylan/chitin deacetylase (PgdA/CDA1 family)